MESLFGGEAFQTYAICVAVLAIKMMLSSVYTGYQRITNSAFATPEDAERAGVEWKSDDAVERALRIQRNDLENIPLFIGLGLIYVLSGGSSFGMAAYGWVFVVARIGHTVSYALANQPVRGFSFAIGLLVNLGLAVNVLEKNF
ncbi:MAG: MAPEG family protein [Myxococcales bacterium]|nr:MAPEG family protein [Myxococcales bacterium]